MSARADKIPTSRWPRMVGRGMILVTCYMFACGRWLYNPYLETTLGVRYRHYNLDRLPESVSTNVSRGETYIWPWFSLRRFWLKRIPKDVEYQCREDTIIFRNAHLNVSKIKGAPVVVFAGGIERVELWKELKENRNLSQLWVFNTDESALLAEQYVPPLEDLAGLQFNITFTYHTKSELSVPYGYYELHPTNDSGRHPGDVDYHKRKSKFAVFMSSHCHTIAWPRGKFAKDLSDHVPLDRFGTCGNLSSSNCPRGSSECVAKLKQYKFILALENTCCEEYITEKFWRPLQLLESIPVVLGANKEDYARVGPPNSFIHVGDFNSMKELASYLRQVADDPALYNSYFAWKRTGYVRQTSDRLRRIRYQDSVCHLHEYIKSGAWANVEEHLQVYGEHWLGGCKGCSQKEWISSRYGKAPGKYTHN